MYLGSMIVAGLVSLSLVFGIVALWVTFLRAKRAANAATSGPEDRTDSSSAASKGKL